MNWAKDQDVSSETRMPSWPSSLLRMHQGKPAAMFGAVPWRRSFVKKCHLSPKVSRDLNPASVMSASLERALPQSRVQIRPQPQVTFGFPAGAHGKEPTCQVRRCKRRRFYPWVRKITWRRKWQPTPVFLPRGPHRQRSLVGYSPWGCKELDRTQAT